MTSETRSEARTTYHNLDALRGIAAIMVVLFHASYWSGYPIAMSGYLAVDVFFVLSGFVIAHSYDVRLASDLTTFRFSVIRIVRFWPLYTLGLVLGLALEVSLIMTHNHYAQPIYTIMASAALGLVFLPTLFHTRFDSLFPLNEVSWSLFYELIVNILYSAFFRFLSMKVLCATVLVTGFLLCFYAVGVGSVSLGFDRFSIFPGLVRTTFSFSIGVVIYRSGWRKLRIPLWLLSIVLVGLLAAPVPANWRVAYDLLAVMLASPVIVLAGSSSQPRLRAKQLAAHLGAISYAIYTLHRPLISFADTATRRFHFPAMLSIIVFTFGMVVLSFWLNEHFDKPARRWLMARFGLAGAPKPREASLP